MTLQDSLRLVLSDQKINYSRLNHLATLLKHAPSRVIRGKYRAGENACIFGHLIDATSRSERLRFFGDRPSRLASDFVVKGWDAGVLTHQALLAEILDAMALRLGICPTIIDQAITEDEAMTECMLAA